MYIEDFHLLVGETIMFCQTIENDIKYIYAGMLSGDFYDNYGTVEKQTLGNTIKKLEKLDNSDGNPYFSKEDYKLLYEITDKRNHIAHLTYRKFIYKDGYEHDEAFQKEYNNLKSFHDRMSSLYKVVENIRLDVLKKYNRI